jgi:hypothetical protein
MLASVTAILAPWRKTILWLSGIVFCLFILNWWLFFYSSWGIPARIPIFGISISITGGVTLIICLITLLYFQKKVLSTSPETSVFTLTWLCALPIIIAEHLFQLVNWGIVTGYTFIEQLSNIFGRSILFSLLFLLISFRMALKQKKKDTQLLDTSIGIIVVLFYLINRQMI